MSLKSQSTSFSGLPKMEQSFPPDSPHSASTRCITMEHRDRAIFARPYTIEPKKITYKGDGTTALEASAETMNPRSFRPGGDAELHFERADGHAF
jgi:hypothetical protein